MIPAPTLRPPCHNGWSLVLLTIAILCVVLAHYVKCDPLNIHGELVGWHGDPREFHLFVRTADGLSPLLHYGAAADTFWARCRDWPGDTDSADCVPAQSLITLWAWDGVAYSDTVRVTNPGRAVLRFSRTSGVQFVPWWKLKLGAMQVHTKRSSSTVEQTARTLSPDCQVGGSTPSSAVPIRPGGNR